MNEAFTEEYESLVASLSNEYHKKYAMVEREDIAQVLWMWFVTHQNKYKEWSALETKDKEKLIAKSLGMQPLSIAKKKKRVRLAMS